MADAEETLVGFVTARYNKLISELTDDHEQKSKAVIVLINALFETFKNTDSKHDAIVEKLAELQKAYIELESSLDLNDYPRYANASANLKTIMAELKDEKDVGGEE